MAFSDLIRRLEVSHEPGLTHAQLLLTVRLQLLSSICIF